MPTFPRVIIIAGCCGAGKTTIGKGIAELLGYQYFDADDFHSEENVTKMSRGEPLTDEDRFPWLNRLNNLLNSPGKMVLSFSALKKKYRKTLLENNEDACVFLLRVPRNVLLERINNRPQHFAKANLIDSQLEIYESPSPDETNIVEIDNCGGPDEAISIIRNMLEKENM